MKLIIIRHGITEANQNRLYYGATDIGLIPEGIKELNEKKRAMPEIDPQKTRILTSGMKRCEDTLRILYGDLPHETEPDLAELNFGDFEMKSYDELKDLPDYQDWISSFSENGDNNKKAPNGESNNEFKERVIRALSEVLSREQDTLIVTHGGVIATIMAELFPEENKNRFEWQSPPGGGYEIDIDKKTHSSF